MSRSVLVGIDLGTSSTKTVLIAEDGHLLASASREYPVNTPHPGWAEQDPESWLQAAIQTVRLASAQSGVSPDRIAAIGLSGQMHGMVILDAAGAPLGPAIIWADQRSRDQVAHVYHELGTQQLGRWTGNPLATGFMLASWLWLREQSPDVARTTTHLLLPKDYLRFRLTGELGSEPSDASSTLMFDTAGRHWSLPLLQALGIDPRLLPSVGESAAVAGGLRADIAMQTGLHPGTPVVFGGSDQALQALGHGVIDPGTVSCTIGTGGQLFAPVRDPLYDPELRLHLFCHALPNRWHLEAAILAAGLSLRWLRDNVLHDKSYGMLADTAAAVQPGAEGLFFLPHLAGERTPHMDPQASGAFVGLTLRHGQQHMVRAVMEGVVFALRQGLDLMLTLGVAAERIVASGGATAHPLWLQLQADIFNRPIYRTATLEAAAVGAALLAGVGAGVYRDARDACRQTVTRQDAKSRAFCGEVIDPIPENVALYEDAYRIFCRLYPALSAAGFGKDQQRICT